MIVFIHLCIVSVVYCYFILSSPHSHSAKACWPEEPFFLCPLIHIPLKAWSKTPLFLSPVLCAVDRFLPVCTRERQASSGGPVAARFRDADYAEAGGVIDS